MIEIEKKLNPPSEIIDQIKSDAVFVESRTMNDIFYDYKDFSMIRNDIWLRKRNGRFDLKVSRDKDMKNRDFDIYDEIEDESKICKTLNIESIEKESFIEVANLITRREKYKIEDFNIDFDLVTSMHDNFVYRLMEVELMVKDDYDTAIALEKIKRFMNKYNIEDRHATAKLIQYFYEKKQHIYDILQQ